MKSLKSELKSHERRWELIEELDKRTGFANPKQAEYVLIICTNTFFGGKNKKENGYHLRSILSKYRKRWKATELLAEEFDCKDYKGIQKSLIQLSCL